MAARAIPVSPLTGASVAQALAARAVTLPQVTVLTATESTNDEALSLAAEGAPEWTVVAADEQTAGRGRLGRSWVSPPGHALLFSVVLRPDRSWPMAVWGWIPLIAGLAVTDTIRGHGVPAELKWPNDVVIDGPAHDGSAGPRKLAGILAERRGDAVVVGVGINVHHTASMLPIPAATSLALEGVEIARSSLLAECLLDWDRYWQQLRATEGDLGQSNTRSAYLARSLTVGRRVRVDLGGGNDLVGEAVEVDLEGHLRVEGAFGCQVVSAGDVTHLRH